MLIILHLKKIELNITEVTKTKEAQQIKLLNSFCIWNNFLVNLTTTQVETFFGELEYIEPRLKALGVTLADEEVGRA